MTTSNIVMCETLPNDADWDCFKAPIMQEIFYDSKSTSSGIMCIYGSHTFFQSVGCVMFKLQFRTDLPETEIISLDAGLWLDRRPVLDLRDLFVAIFHGNTYRAAPHKLQTVKKTHGMMIWTM